MFIFSLFLKIRHFIRIIMLNLLQKVKKNYFNFALFSLQQYLFAGLKYDSKHFDVANVSFNYFQKIVGIF